MRRDRRERREGERGGETEGRGERNVECVTFLSSKNFKAFAKRSAREARGACSAFKMWSFREAVKESKDN